MGFSAFFCHTKYNYIIYVNDIIVNIYKHNVRLIKYIMNRVKQLEDIQTNARELFSRKNADYGDSFAKYGLIGVIMRIEDKIQRLISINKSGIVLVSDEGLRDTLLDLHNYAAMAIMLLDEDDST